MSEAIRVISQSENEHDARLYFKEARSAFSALVSSTVKSRISQLPLIRAALLQQREIILDSLMRECGKTRTDALIEFVGTVDWIKWLEGHAGKLLKNEKVPTPIILLGKRFEILHEPLGVVLIIAPWNYPLHTGVTQILTAFICGNSIVYKPSEITPMQGIYEKIFATAPMVDQTVKMAYGDGDLGRCLIDQVPEKIFFTGSSRTGKMILKQAAEHLIPVDIELGGKDPMIVFEGASIKRSVAAAIWGSFTHNGQSCSAVERLYVQDTIYDEFLAVMKIETAKIVQQLLDEGSADIGRLTVDFQLDIVKEHIADAISKGAQLVIGGNVLDEDKLLHQPTILANTTPAMKVVSEETFGPVVAVMKFHSEEEAIALANDSNYGLQASVFTADKTQGNRVARKLEVGGVSINNVNMVEGNPGMSFGGRKHSGNGRARGVEGVMAYTRSKHILCEPNSDRLEINWYPYTKEKYNGMTKLINVLYNNSPWRLIKAAMIGLPLEWRSQKPRD